MKQLNDIFGDGCFIIAEIGVNHDGKIEQAKKLIDKAIDAGASCVKFQSFITEEILIKSLKKAAYQERNTGDGSYYDMIKNLEFSEEQFKELKQYCDQKDIMFLSTPMDFKSVDRLTNIGVDLFKVDSANLTNLPLLKYMASKNKPLIISSGLSTLSNIEEALDAIKDVNPNIDFILLHCTSNYPTPAKEVNLRAMLTLKDAFKCKVGFSDHSEGIVMPIAAVALGARLLEKHFTLDKTLPGPDHKASLNPNELKELVNAIRRLEVGLGDGIKKPVFSEIDTKRALSKSIVTLVDIPKGTKITSDMLSIKRPGNGLHSRYLPWVIGKKTTKDVSADSLFLFDYITED